MYVQIGYRDGSGAAVTVGYDKVEIGGMTVTSQAVEIATDVSPAFMEDATDGLVGPLGFRRLIMSAPSSRRRGFRMLSNKKP